MNDVKLLNAQFTNTAGIFACDDYMAMTAGKKLVMGQGWPTTKIAPVDGTDLQSIAEMHKNAWNEILSDGRFQSADFTIKVDPSTVFFPDRVCKHLIELNASADIGTYVATCNKSGPSKMLGPMEILSRSAVETFSRGKEETCGEELEYKTMDEDVFLQACLEMLNVSPVFYGDMLADESCEPAQCSDVQKAGYSPYSNATDWLDCWELSDESEEFADLPVDTVDARDMMKMLLQ
jgi:hypothetical protein